MPIANLTTAMSLPAPDVEALIQGRAIAAIASRWLDPGEKFALYPAEMTPLPLSDEERYRPNFLPIAKIALDRIRSEGAIVKAWAKCELCQMLDGTAPLEALSELTIWTAEAFQKILSQRPYIFLAYLRIYQLSQHLEMPAGAKGNFIPLPQSISVAETSPVSSDRVFSRRCHQLQNRLPPEHPELEDLEACVSQYATTHPAANALAREIQVFLNWSDVLEKSESNPEKDWITKIAEVGNSSEGNEFERLVRKSFIELGFSNSKTEPNLKDGLNPEKTGGAGGLDLYCDTPYQVVGECKATKTEKVPDGTPAQLVKLGQKFLNTTPDRQSKAGQYEKCIKIILAAGELTQAAKQTAIGNQMNVLRPETLQRLVELKNRYPGSVDLLTLKSCLEKTPFGEDADTKVNAYIDDLLNDIELRSRIVKAVKELSEQKSESSANCPQSSFVTEVRTHYNATQKPILTDRRVRDFLIELSSPLTGYLGQEKGNDEQSDRFYFLKELEVE